ncbi:GRIP and coiled-coil domain-containing protein 1-like [Anguilla rostrata]|uniref:GRIP and coiled-coil domain-containing protein 1-like n=1 Tax=Anguilla rostrata TaxID=7938 RepID=UPI0030CF2200
MPFNWRWLFVIALLNLKLPQFVVDPGQFPGADYDVLLFPRTDSLLYCRPDGQFLIDQRILPIGSEIDSAGESTGRSTALLPKGTPIMHLDICPLPDICLASDRPSTGEASFNKIDEMKDSASSLKFFTNILLQAELHIRAYSEMIINILPQKWQPGSVFHQTATMVMSMTPALDVLMILVFIWRRVKSRTNQLTNKQLLEQFAQQMDESHVKFSALNKKIVDTKEKIRRTKRMLSSSHRKNWNLKASARELQRRCMKICEERDALDLMLKERENRIKSADLEQEKFKKTFQEKEMALQQKLEQLEQDWKAKLEKAMKDRSEHEQRVKKEIQALLLKLCKTEQLHQTQIHDCEVKYRDSLKLVSELQHQIEQHEVVVLQSKQEKLAKAASDVLEAKRRMAMSREKYQEHNWKKAF